MKKLFTIFLLTVIVVNNFSCSKDSTSTGLPSVNSENDKQVGASANALLSAATYTSVKIEIQYMPGFAPDATAVSNLTAFFTSLINKPAGITVVQTQIASPNKVVLSLTDIATIEKSNRTVFTTGNQLGVYFLYTDGTYTDNSVLGLAFRNTSIAVLGKTAHDNSGAIGQVSRTKLESTVLEHEGGHILGLVDIGSPMQTNHKDAAHGNHCDNTSCLMYYSAETTDALGVLITGAIPALDANCKADLHANGGK